jgi:hypothetical protein
VDYEELLKFLKELVRITGRDKRLIDEIKGDLKVEGNVVSLNGKSITRRLEDGWKLFRDLERLRMIGVVEVDNLTFSVNRERLQEEIEQLRRQIKANRDNTRKTVAELFIKVNTLNVRIEIGDKTHERRVQRLNYGSNIEALLTYGLSHPGKLITIEEVQATRKQNDFKLRDIADTLSKDKAKALEPILDVFFEDMSKRTVVIRPMAAIGIQKAKEILHYYDK